MAMIVQLPKFSSKFEAARYAVSWAQSNPLTYVNYGGPKYPVPSQEYLDQVKNNHGITIVASAGCELSNYEDVFADVVNSLLRSQDRWRARQCVAAYLKHELVPYLE